jgi:hypothetical protein
MNQVRTNRTSCTGKTQVQPLVGHRVTALHWFSLTPPQLLQRFISCRKMATKLSVAGRKKSSTKKKNDNNVIQKHGREQQQRRGVTGLQGNAGRKQPLTTANHNKENNDDGGWEKVPSATGRCGKLKNSSSARVQAALVTEEIIRGQHYRESNEQVFDERHQQRREERSNALQRQTDSDSSDDDDGNDGDNRVGNAKKTAAMAHKRQRQVFLEDDEDNDNIGHHDKEREEMFNGTSFS